jgi:hypothetical protein
LEEKEENNNNKKHGIEEKNSLFSLHANVVELADVDHFIVPSLM